jgi:FAS-associated factor 2
LKEGGEGVDEKVAEPEGFEHSYGFRLVSPMPREVFALEAGGTIKDRIGRSGNLIVETLDDGESGDESGADD